MVDRDDKILHEAATKEVISEVIQQESIFCEILESSPAGVSWQGGIYAPSSVTSGSMTLEVTGPDATIYEVVLQAADLLDSSLALAAFNLALPSADLFRIWPSNPSSPSDGQLSAMASNEWANTAGVSIVATSLTLDAGVLGEDAGAYTIWSGSPDYSADNGTFVKHDGDLYYRQNDKWWALANGIQSTDIQAVLNLVVSDNSPRRQSIDMIPEFRAINFSVHNDEVSSTAAFYISAQSELGAILQFSSMGLAGQGSSYTAAGTIDPTSGDGLAFSSGCLYTRDMGDGTSELWFHQGPTDTDWTRIVPPAV